MSSKAEKNENHRVDVEHSLLRIARKIYISTVPLVLQSG